MTRRSFSKTKRGRRLIAALACLAVFAGGLYYVYSEVSDGEESAQWAHYKTEREIDAPFGALSPGSSIEAKWKDAEHEIPGLFVSLIGYDADAGKARVCIEGFTYKEGGFGGVVLLSHAGQVAEAPHTLAVSPSDGGLAIVIASATGLVLGVFLLIRRR
jgi:hypothetical protein